MRSFVHQIIPAILGSASVAIAAESSSHSGLSPLTIAFLSFFGLVIVFQLIPGILLFISALKGVFGKRAARTETESDRPV